MVSIELVGLRTDIVDFTGEKIMKIAVVDDTQEDREHLREILDRYQKENATAHTLHFYSSSIEFLEQYRADYDIIFLDVEMPGSDGMTVAKEIRQIDVSAAILFVTNMAQYATKGYEVDAVDYMIKPVSYENVADKLNRAIRRVSHRNSRKVMIKGEELVWIYLDDIYYIRKDGNSLIYHTNIGTYRARGSISKLIKEWSSSLFEECCSGILVNLSAVERIGKESVFVHGDELPFSRRLRKKFIERFMNYAGDFV